VTLTSFIMMSTDCTLNQHYSVRGFCFQSHWFRLLMNLNYAAVLYTWAVLS